MDELIIKLPKGKKQIVCDAMWERWQDPKNNGKEETPEELTIRMIKNTLIETLFQAEANKAKRKLEAEGLKME